MIDRRFSESRVLNVDDYLDYITNRALPKAPNAAEASPLPKDETTPPVMNIKRAIVFRLLP